MRSRCVIPALFLLVAVGLAVPGSRAAAPAAPEKPRPQRPEELRFEPLRYRPPEPRTSTLSNGLRLAVLEDSSLPLVQGVLLLQVGSLDDPPQGAGLAEVVGDLLRTGGTLTRAAEEVDDEIDFLGAEIEVSVSEELTVIHFSALSRDLDRVLVLVSDLVRNPAFRQDRLDLELGQMREEVRRRWDDPGSISDLRLADLIYGPASRWARRPTERTLEPIRQDACRSFHRRHYAPGGASLGLAGDLDAASMRRKAETLFGLWRGVPPKPRPHEDLREASAPGIYWIERDLAQSQVAIGHLGARRLGPDHYALEILNLIVGGGFTSRLFKEVRSARGLAYHVGGGVDEGYDRGLFRIDLQTRPEQVPEALAAVRQVIQGARQQAPAAAELQVARDHEANRFVFNFASPGAIVEARLTRAALEYPADYLDTYLERIGAVSAEDVLRVARGSFNPDRLVTLVVGPEAAVAPLRTSSAEVLRIPLEPEIPPEAPK